MGHSPSNTYSVFYNAKDNMVTQELVAHDDIQRAAAAESLPRYSAYDVVSSMLLKHPEILHQTLNQSDSDISQNNVGDTDFSSSARSLRSYKKELNYKVCIYHLVRL